MSFFKSLFGKPNKSVSSQLQNKTNKSSDNNFEKELTKQAKERSKSFNDIHNSEKNKLNLKDITLISNATLKPEEILLLRYIDSKSVDLDYLPAYFTHEYHINYIEAFGKFFGGEYLTYHNPDFAINKLNTSEIKEKLANKGLPQTGKKAVLIERLLQALTDNELDSYRNQYFEVTTYGKSIIDENDYIYYAHSLKNRTSVSIYDLGAELKRNNGLSKEQAMRNLLFDRLNLNASNNQAGWTRNDFLSISYTYTDSEYKDSLVMLIAVCYLDYLISQNYDFQESPFIDAIIQNIKSIIDNNNCSIDDSIKAAEDTLRKYAQSGLTIKTSQFKKIRSELKATLTSS